MANKKKNWKLTNLPEKLLFVSKSVAGLLCGICHVVLYVSGTTLDITD